MTGRRRHPVLSSPNVGWVAARSADIITIFFIDALDVFILECRQGIAPAAKCVSSLSAINRPL